LAKVGQGKQVCNDILWLKMGFTTIFEPANFFKNHHAQNFTRTIVASNVGASLSLSSVERAPKAGISEGG
jgi:hypothetical protein